MSHFLPVLVVMRDMNKTDTIGFIGQGFIGGRMADDCAGYTYQPAEEAEGGCIITL